MKTSTIITTMLAGVAACALSTAPALAGAPNIHLAGIFKTPGRINTHAKTVTGTRAPHAGTSNLTSTVDLTYSVSSHYDALLFAYTWYRITNSKCVQPTNQKQKYTKAKAAKIKKGSSSSANPCGTGNFTYLGPVYKVKKATKPADFKGKLTAADFYGQNLLLNENVTVHIQ